ncbi:NYN domain-containing protein [Bacillus sp. FJAT-27245]|uniref:NYN domain-containing protein n=1 Tax=Bacillus sp. FJAT-27245 TaxID=1684144 RepID=UPI0006A7B70A|nr:NYN domain-containing protein [Bacillus sp. FJAT-27245]
MNNVAIFWDLDNTHLTIQEQFGTQEGYLINLIDAVDNLFADDSIRIFRAYADFEKIRKVQSEIQKKKVTPKHVFSSNSGTDSRKNASDIELCLDALEIAIKNIDITHFVIISADKDMIPLMHRLKYYGKNVYLIYLEAAISEDKLVLDFCDEKKSLEELINLVKKDPNKLTEDEFTKGTEDAVEVVVNFYERNKEKPHVFFGLPFYKQDMISKGYSGEVAETILRHCLENCILQSEDLGGNKFKISIKNEAKVGS